MSVTKPLRVGSLAIEPLVPTGFDPPNDIRGLAVAVVLSTSPTDFETPDGLDPIECLDCLAREVGKIGTGQRGRILVVDTNPIPKFFDRSMRFTLNQKDHIRQVGIVVVIVVSKRM
jgi:hypothetical protein